MITTEAWSFCLNNTVAHVIYGGGVFRAVLSKMATRTCLTLPYEQFRLPLVWNQCRPHTPPEQAVSARLPPRRADRRCADKCVVHTPTVQISHIHMPPQPDKPCQGACGHGRWACERHTCWHTACTGNGCEDDTHVGTPSVRAVDVQTTLIMG